MVLEKGIDLVEMGPEMRTDLAHRHPRDHRCDRLFGDDLDHDFHGCSYAAISFSLVAQSSDFFSARSKRSKSSPISASVMTSGGQNATRSPSSGRTRSPSSCAKPQSVAAA